MVPATKYRRRKTQMMNIDILNKPLLKSLLNKTIYFHDVMNAYSIKTSAVCSLPAGVLGLVYVRGTFSKYTHW